MQNVEEDKRERKNSVHYILSFAPAVFSVCHLPSRYHNNEADVMRFNMGTYVNVIFIIKHITSYISQYHLVFI